MSAVIVIPVRMVIDGRVLQSTSRALDPDGIFIRCVSPPLPGALVQLRLYLPDGAPEDLDAVIVAERILREVGCRAQFAGLTPAQGERIARLSAPPIMQRAPGKVLRAPSMESQPRSPQAKLELRALARVPAQLKVAFGSVEEAAERLAVDISAGGMFVHTDLPPWVGEEVMLVFAIPDGDSAKLSCRGQVVRRIAREEARFTAQVPGAGVQFLDASDEFRERLDAWLATAQGLTLIDE
jgi:uncharacterized protein (TIGR02266 family)